MYEGCVHFRRSCWNCGLSVGAQCKCVGPHRLEKTLCEACRRIWQAERARERADIMSLPEPKTPTTAFEQVKETLIAYYGEALWTEQVAEKVCQIARASVKAEAKDDEGLPFDPSEE
jgi:hypothetical protein